MDVPNHISIVDWCCMFYEKGVVRGAHKEKRFFLFVYFFSFSYLFSKSSPVSMTKFFTPSS